MGSMLIALNLDFVDSHNEAVDLDNQGKNIWTLMRSTGQMVLKQGVFIGPNVNRYVILPGLVDEPDILVEDWDEED